MILLFVYETDIGLKMAGGGDDEASELHQNNK